MVLTAEAMFHSVQDSQVFSQVFSILLLCAQLSEVTAMVAERGGSH